MTRLVCGLVVIAMTTAPAAGADLASTAVDPRLREVIYNPKTVVTVPVKRGVVTLIELGQDESITEVAAGLGGDCAKAEAAWCVAAQPGGRSLFVKPKSSARAANNLAVITDRRSHSLRFVVLPDGDPQAPTYRLVIKAPAPTPQARLAARERPTSPEPPEPVAIDVHPNAAELVTKRLQAKPQVLNTSYSIAEGTSSVDIVPTLIFDDGRFTYLRFPGNREVPAVFQVLGDGSETLVNARMEDDLLVVDRVGRRLMLRAGAAVVGVWNDAFDLEGAPPAGGTTVPGVERRLRTEEAKAATPAAGPTRESTR